MQKILTSLIRTKYSPSIWLYSLGLILFFALRLIHIHSIPAVISHDETYYPAEARALAVSGHDPSGTWVPWSLTSAHPLYAELPGLVMTPAALLFNDPIIAARITHIVLGTLFCGVLTLFMYTLTKKKELAAITFILAGFNPWLFQFSRMGFDALLSLFFFFSGLTLYLRLSDFKKLWAIPFFFLGFFQYQGLKVIFVPLVLGTVMFEYFSRQQTSWQQIKTFFFKKQKIAEYLPTLLVISFTVILFGSYLLRLSNQAAGERSADLIFSDSTYNAEKTNLDRQQTLDTPFNTFFINKGVAVFDRFVSQYFESFSWHHLFISGEPLRNPFSVWKHGMFYLADIVLLALGVVHFFTHSDKKRQAVGWYLLFLTFIAPLAGALNAKGSWIMFRSSLLVPTFILIASFGTWYLYQKLPRWVFVLAVAVYAVFVTRFFFLYFASYPIIGTQGEYFSERVIANYIARNPDKHVIVYASEPRFMFETVMVFNNVISKENISSINAAYASGEYQLDNFLITNRCYEPQEDPAVVSIVHQATPTCDGMSDATSTDISAIPSLIDSGAIYTLHNDSFCGEYGLGSFSHVTENRFAVEQQTDQLFCETFFIRN